MAGSSKRQASVGSLSFRCFRVPNEGLGSWSFSFAVVLLAWPAGEIVEATIWIRIYATIVRLAIGIFMTSIGVVAVLHCSKLLKYLTLSAIAGKVKGTFSSSQLSIRQNSIKATPQQRSVSARSKQLISNGVPSDQQYSIFATKKYRSYSKNIHSNVFHPNPAYPKQAVLPSRNFLKTILLT